MSLNLLAQMYNTTTPASDTGAAIFGGVWFLVWLVVAIVLLAGIWKMFQKAGKPGWAAIVPIYNTIVLLEIAGRPLWWIILLLVPFVNIVLIFVIGADVAKSFGKSGAWGAILCGLLGGIGYAILGFGSAQYQGGSAAAAAQNNTPATPQNTSSTPPAAPTAQM